MTVNGLEVGSDVALESPDPTIDVQVELKSSRALDDSIELVLGGAVIDSRPAVLSGPGTVNVAFEDVPIARSSWVAARLGTQRAHTAAVYVTLDGAPIADCVAAEYWMMWCDIVGKSTLDHPELDFFGAQKHEALQLMAMARRAFKTLRDIEGFDPAWGVTRRGRSTAACRGPIAIGTTGPVRTGQGFRLTCANAPPLAQGLVYVSRAPDPAGTCDVDVRFFVATDAGSLIGTYTARSTHSGYSEVFIPAVPPGTTVVHAQFVWTNPPGCAGTACGGGSAARSASDALEMAVQ
jgi:hypothetical protein